MRDTVSHGSVLRLRVAGSTVNHWRVDVDFRDNHARIGTDCYVGRGVNDDVLRVNRSRRGVSGNRAKDNSVIL